MALTCWTWTLLRVYAGSRSFKSCRLLGRASVNGVCSAGSHSCSLGLGCGDFWRLAQCPGVLLCSLRCSWVVSDTWCDTLSCRERLLASGSNFATWEISGMEQGLGVCKLKKRKNIYMHVYAYAYIHVHAFRFTFLRIFLNVKSYRSPRISVKPGEIPIFFFIYFLEANKKPKQPQVLSF